MSTKLAILGMISTVGIHFIFLSTQILWYGLDIGTKKLSVFMILAIFHSIFSSLAHSVVERSSAKSASSDLFSTFEKLILPCLLVLVEKSCPILESESSTDTPIIKRSYLRSPLDIIACISFGPYGIN